MPRETAKQRAYERSANRRIEGFNRIPKKGKLAKEVKLPRHPMLHRRMFHEMMIDPWHCQTPVTNPIVIGPPCHPRVVQDYYDWPVAKPNSTNTQTGDLSLFARAAIMIPHYPFTGFTWGNFCENNGVNATIDAATTKIQTFDDFRGRNGITLHQSTVATDISTSDGNTFLARTNVVGIRITALGAPATQTGTLHVWRPRQKIPLNSPANTQANLFDNENDNSRICSIPISKLAKDGPITFVVRSNTLDDFTLKGAPLSGSLNDANWGINDAPGVGYGATNTAGLYLFVERPQGAAVALPDQTNEIIRVEYICYYDFAPPVSVSTVLSEFQGSAAGAEAPLHDPHAVHGPQLADVVDSKAMKAPEQNLKKGGAAAGAKDEIMAHGQNVGGI